MLVLMISDELVDAFSKAFDRTVLPSGPRAAPPAEDQESKEQKRYGGPWGGRKADETPDNWRRAPRTQLTGGAESKGQSQVRERYEGRRQVDNTPDNWRNGLRQQPTFRAESQDQSRVSERYGGRHRGRQIDNTPDDWRKAPRILPNEGGEDFVTLHNNYFLN